MEDELIVERRVVLPASAEEVWDMLTRGPELSRWFGAAATLDPRPGGRATFLWPDGTERSAVVEMVDPKRALVLRWLPFERDERGRSHPRPASRIRFVLEDDAEGTRLCVTESTESSSETTLIERARRFEVRAT